MTPVLERTLALFLSPASPTPERGAWEPPVPVLDAVSAHTGEASPSAPSGALTVVLGASSGVVPLGAALANELRCRARAGAALLMVWAPSGPAVPAAPAWPATRRLAERHALREPSAVARGKLVRVDLPADPEVAAAEIPALVAGDVPAVLVMAGPRPAAFDAPLAAAKLVVLVPDAEHPPTLTGLATDELRRTGPEVMVIPPLTGAVGRVLANAGLGRLRRLPSEAVTDA